MHHLVARPAPPASRCARSLSDSVCAVQNDRLANYSHLASKPPRACGIRKPFAKWINYIAHLFGCFFLIKFLQCFVCVYLLLNGVAWLTGCCSVLEGCNYSGGQRNDQLNKCLRHTTTKNYKKPPPKNPTQEQQKNKKPKHHKQTQQKTTPPPPPPKKKKKKKKKKPTKNTHKKPHEKTTTQNDQTTKHKKTTTTVNKQKRNTKTPTKPPTKHTKQTKNHKQKTTHETTQMNCRVSNKGICLTTSKVRK